MWSEIEHAQEASEVKHPAVRYALQYLEIDRGVEIHHFADLPSRTGLGSSSAFTVGLLHALRALQGESPGAAELAAQAIYLEQTIMAETVGIQDQIQTAHGGLNYVQIERNGQYSIRPIVLTPERLSMFRGHLLLFYTGISRHASTIAAGQVANIAAGERDGEMRCLADMASKGAEILTGGHSLAEFGLMLHNAWMLKRGLSEKVSTPDIDAMYEAARRAGALGGKLLGAGGGGFLLLFARPEVHPEVRRAMGRCLEVPFRVEFSGSRVIYGAVPE